MGFLSAVPRLPVNQGAWRPETVYGMAEDLPHTCVWGRSNKATRCRICGRTPGGNFGQPLVVALNLSQPVSEPYRCSTVTPCVCVRG